MKLRVGDIVEFKNWEYMADNESKFFVGGFSPKSGKIIEIKNNGLFLIEDWKHEFDSKSVARVISDDDSLNQGDEVLVKATVKEVFNGFVQINPSVDKTDVVKILKRKEPEHFIVKEDRYGMYIYGFGVLISNKDDAKIYSSRNEANKVAADMHLNAWEVIKYDD